MDIYKVFAQNVKKYRNQIGITQEAFAENAGLHRTYISDIETCKRSISLGNIQKIAIALNVPVYKLFTEEDEVID